MTALKEIFKVKESFKNRTLGFWIGMGAGLFILVATIILIALYNSGSVFYHPDDRDKVRMAWLFVFFFIGVGFQVIQLITDLRFASLIPVVFYSLGVGMYFYLAMFPLADAITGIAFFGGNVGTVIAFLLIFVISALASVASCFMKQRKTVS